ncbi:serine carboxypeptidase [Kwoniella heveanensis BCC8398]|uniref:Serine carboxypeptidase n=1 Tax=Kwoniella heveanensis BCC8398 TaxID=1296120 RepID=A0A1B9GXF8_9TREE|nr:serine carboxypeptidase [Kwoniella heveanensis BCC8398]
MIAFTSTLLLLSVLAATSIEPTLASSSISIDKRLDCRAKLDSSLHRELLLNGRPQIGLWKALLKQQKIQHEAKEVEEALFSTDQHLQLQLPLQSTTTTSRPQSKAHSKFGPHCFPQKISHFDDAVNGTFCQRYWIDASSYKEGGPVFLLDGGETSGADRVPFLEQGILQILSNATGGIGIVLEHRYYGDSVPVESFSTDDLRFLNNAEAMEDSANLIRNFKPPSSVLSVEDGALHPNNTAWIYYGGSYAGARAAHMRVQYPHLVWGAIASSAVTHAQINFPEYYDPIQRYAPEECITTLQQAILIIDSLLNHPEPIPTLLKGVFGLSELAGNDDFADVIQAPLGYWQAKNWDPKVGSTHFYEFCDALTAGGAGSKLGLIRIPASIVNYGAYIKQASLQGHPASDIEECFGSQDDTKFQETDLEQTWRLWLFQVCTQWGYFMPAPAEGLPRIVSNQLTLDYTSKVCKQAFPPGKHFTVPIWPDVAEVNNRGDYGIEYERLAFIDGDRDPWRPMTPQSDWAPKRNSSVSKPVHLIFDGVHHYDEADLDGGLATLAYGPARDDMLNTVDADSFLNPLRQKNGLADHSKEPFRIRDVHQLEKNFVGEWVAQFADEKQKREKEKVEE